MQDLSCMCVSNVEKKVPTLLCDRKTLLKTYEDASHCHATRIWFVRKLSLDEKWVEFTVYGQMLLGQIFPGKNVPLTVGLC